MKETIVAKGLRFMYMFYPQYKKFKKMNMQSYIWFPAQGFMYLGYTHSKIMGMLWKKPVLSDMACWIYNQGIINEVFISV